MTIKEIYLKTLVFGWIKLGLGILNIGIALLLFALLMGISVLFESKGSVAILFFIWLALVGMINFVLNHYIGYLVKAGHVAVISNAFKQGTIPNNPVTVGKEMVKKRFGTSNVYFALDKLVAGSVKQLQRTLGQLTDSLFGAIPGMDSVKSLTNLFLDISLGYIDECCLGYTFYQDKQNPYKSAADGVVIYAQNWKTLLKDSTKTTGVVILSLTVVTLAAFIIFGGLFHLFGWSGFVAFVLSILFAWSVKYAFIDSWILVKMMSSYMQVAPTTVITFDLYGKLSGFSGKFKELFRRSSESYPQPKSDTGQPATTTETTQVVPAADTPIPPKDARRFCPSCGNPLTEGKTFCGNCGTRIGISPG
ncbi:hypothetical protein DMB45_01120 [Sanguibacteroides justesenii]|uniref:zinc ribbon domain-containing protein n=1 Tax=Sanguibacteroides justesenii TaxID=1547597 RepID=UPI000D9B648D|nr:zinc ribbon domain-containing protein [Sanguibacteroides justesenii]PXZ45070.1 hypothetical protein DMB45_01120 [Sanguibacteroides justesenii]